MYSNYYFPYSGFLPVKSPTTAHCTSLLSTRGFRSRKSREEEDRRFRAFCRRACLEWQQQSDMPISTKYFGIDVENWIVSHRTRQPPFLAAGLTVAEWKAICDAPSLSTAATGGTNASRGSWEITLQRDTRTGQESDVTLLTLIRVV